MAKIYRYRSVESAVTGFAEIAKQEIYLASPSEMNDPNEVRLNVSWSADKIAWDGLLDHFVRSCAITQSSTPVEQIAVGGIIIPGYHILTHQAEGYGKDIRDLPEIRGAVRTTAADLYGNRFDINGMARAIAPLNEQIKQAVSRYPFNGPTIIPMVEQTDERSGRAIPRFQFPPTPSLLARLGPNPPHTRLPDLYTARMSELTTRPWYAACFSKTYNQQAMWTHYAQEGRGICLEFETDSLNLQQCQLLDVVYADYLPEVELLPYAGARLVESEAMSIYRPLGQKSSFTPDFDSLEQRSLWHEGFDNRTKQTALTKTSGWATEQEVRLLSMHLLDGGPGVVNYDSSALTGIIFGERTTQEIKDAVRSIMLSKHRHSPLARFTLYDAVTQSNGLVHNMPRTEQLPRD